MPIYEYRCEKGHTFETIQRMVDEALTSCEVCSAPAVRVLHAPAVHFKGSGFYNTDYGTKKRAREKSASDSKKQSETKSADSASASSSEKKSEGDSGAKKADKSPAAS